MKEKVKARYAARGVNILAVEEQRRRGCLERLLHYCRTEAELMEGSEELLTSLDQSLRHLAAIPEIEFSRA